MVILACQVQGDQFDYETQNSQCIQTLQAPSLSFTQTQCEQLLALLKPSNPDNHASALQVGSNSVNQDHISRILFSRLFIFNPFKLHLAILMIIIHGSLTLGQLMLSLLIIEGDPTAYQHN